MIDPVIFGNDAKNFSLVLVTLAIWEVGKFLILKAAGFKEDETNDRRKPGTLTIGQDTLERIIDEWEKHNNIIKDMLHTMQEHRRVSEDTRAMTLAHDEQTREPLRMIKEIHKKVHRVDQ